MLGSVSCQSTGPESPAGQLTSPDGRVAVEFWLTEDGAPRYTVQLDGKPVLLESKLGLVRDDADFTKGLKLASTSRIKTVKDHYELPTNKRRLNSYAANQRIFHLEAGGRQKLEIIFHVSNGGVAFRYAFPETSTEVRKLSEEVSSFKFSPDTRAWLQPIAVARSGWSEANPSYEEYYEKEIPVGTPSKLGAGWIFPALFRSGDTWVLISETALGRNYCGARLRSESPGGEYRIGFPDPREVVENGAANPESKLPWLTPWRIVVLGSLKTITESTLGTDLANPPTKATTGPKVEPGKAAWSWPLMGDNQTIFPVQKRFIDYAADMGWRYCLVDALWDKQIGDAKLKELVDYGRTKNVKILVWYNSAGGWNTAPQTPRNLMLTHESRIREFDKLKAMGVAGLKVDFFGGDGQSMIAYYHDIMEDAAPYGFAMNFHGATLPRGWHRTYPHLMTMESIRGLEFCTFEQPNADQEPSHCAMIPFTRNVFDPMDFTPMVLDRIPRIQRRTTSGFELALAVLFTSGVQHYAEIPEGMAKAPDYVREFIKGIPSIWEDVQFIDGYPGKLAVVARKGNGRWYVSGINGEATAKEVELDLSGLKAGGPATLIVDGEGGNLSFRQETITVEPGTKVKVSLKPNGGFVIVLR
ncbi:MAG: glycoside hydrolase family 97 catalytic domain-containing protein [Akkermansiaceae bacterium]|nr:glycoside hydrolase family 97 catalytic domain-containing protein [Verrucomicrobiales bacterium]